MTKDKREADNVSYLPKWLTAGREIKAEQSIIYRALKEYLTRVNQNYEVAEEKSLQTSKTPISANKPEIDKKD